MSHHFKKYYGQNFLKNQNTPRKIVEALSPVANVIEVGPGNGVLTQILLEKGFKVTAVEIDADLYPFLEAKFGDNDNFRLIKSSILDLRVTELDFTEYSVIGSLPYNISKKIIAQFLEAEIQPKEIVVMTQFEVAEDYTAKAPDSKFLANYSSAFGKSEFLFRVPKGEFHPKPEVDGGVIKITITEKPDRKFLKFMKSGFANPRKTLANSLGSLFDKSKVKEAISKAGLLETVRAAELELLHWKQLYELINS